MAVGSLLSVCAVVALVPAALLPYRGGRGRDSLFWLVLAVAFVGAATTVFFLFAHGWRTGLGAALWLTITVSLALFAAVALLTAEGWRLAALIFPYLGLLAGVATVWLNAPEQPMGAGAFGAWTTAHIVFALLAYGLLTIGAVAGAAVFIQERALKAKRPTRLSRRLLPVADGERLEARMLALGALALAFGAATGLASHYVLDGALLSFDHKTILSFGALAVLLALLAAQARGAVRGKRAARLVLLAYLLLTFAYPGVKFVTDVLID